MRMRTTIQLDTDVQAALDELRKASDLGVSQAVNLLIRRGLAAPQERKPFIQRTERLGLRIDVRNVSEALELLEGSETR
jgi:hypothetical protein